MPGPRCSVGCGAVELRDEDALVAASEDLATGDLGLVGHEPVELLVANPGGDELRGLLGLLGGLEETEPGEDAVADVDKVVAGEAGQLSQLRDERSLIFAVNSAVRF